MVYLRFALIVILEPQKKKKKKEKRNIEDNIFRCLGEKIWQSFGKELFTLV